jgi:GNAT superfamily N-acetyltransferase
MDVTWSRQTDHPNSTRPVNIRTFQPGDERTQATLFNSVAFALPGFKPATEDEVRKRTRARGFDPGARFYAEVDGQVVGYCVLEPGQGRVSYPWCRKGFEAAAGPLFEAAVQAARERGVTKLFAAYRRDWALVLQFFADHGFARAREVVNFVADPVELPTVANRGGTPIRRMERSDLPALAEMGKGLIRVPPEKMEQYYFANPYFPVEAFLVMDGRGDTGPVAIGVGLESATWADVRKVDPLAPCFRMGAFGTEGLNAKRVNGLFSYVVSKPEHAIPAGLGLLAEASQEMTEGTVHTLAAQCPTDAPHLLNFYSRYFKEQGRFPVLERDL